MSHLMSRLIASTRDVVYSLMLTELAEYLNLYQIIADADEINGFVSGFFH